MFFDKTDKGIVLRVRISPNSSCCCIKGIFISSDNLEFLKVNVVSVPEKGRANKELINFLAKEMKVPKSSFEIIYGDTDRYKKILIYCDVEKVDRLQDLIKEV